MLRAPKPRKPRGPTGPGETCWPTSALQRVPSLCPALRRCQAWNSVLGHVTGLPRQPQGRGHKDTGLRRCWQGPQTKVWGRADPKTNLKPLSPPVTEWGRLENGQEGKEEASRMRKDVLYHHHSHSHIPATEQKEWKINDFQQNGAQECLIRL